MKKVIVISVQPEHVNNTLNHIKNIDVRKSCPEVFKNLKPYEGAEFEVYIYCSKNHGYLSYNDFEGYFYIKRKPKCTPILNGKAVAKFTLRKVSRIYGKETIFGDRFYTKTKEYMSDVEIEGSYDQLKIDAALQFGTYLEDYFDGKLSKDQEERKQEKLIGYAWHIEDLVILDEPLELREHFYEVPDEEYVKWCKENSVHGQCIVQSITKAPQSWRFAYYDGKTND